MAYQYSAPPGAYSRPPGYGAPPPGMSAAPGMDAPPGMAPGTQPGQPGFVPTIPGVNLNAQVIRLGLGDQKPASPADRFGGAAGRNGEGRGSNSEPLGGNRYRPGLGADPNNRNVERERAAVRENMMAALPPTREEVARTIFIGGLTDEAPSDDKIEALLRNAGGLRRWTRARDADDEKCKFGFAEFEDVDSLEAAKAMFGEGIEVPAWIGQQIKKDDDGSNKMIKLLVVIDEQSEKYIEEWTSKRSEQEQNTKQFAIDERQNALKGFIASMANADAFAANAQINGNDADGDVHMEGTNGDTQADTQTVSIPLQQAEDELNDIPDEMRPVVAAEIKAFRERSNRRDIERLKKEEEMEREERQRVRVSRLASPPPTGPAGSTNGVPVGPRDRSGVNGAPSGPRGFRGAQIPADYANGVSFVGANGSTNGATLNQADEDASESDEELEARRRKTREEELERQYLEQERRWLNRERIANTARERERQNDTAMREKLARQKEQTAIRLRNWNDDVEARSGHEDYYTDRSAWLRRRIPFRDQEASQDAADREAGERRAASSATARGEADAFLDQAGAQIAAHKHYSSSTAAAAGPVKISLGGRNKPVPAPAQPLADVEGLLEDEEDAATASGRKPALKPLSDTSTLPVNGTDLSPEDRAQARQQLASEIPTTAQALFAWPIKWDTIPIETLLKSLRPMVEKKVVEYLGVQEELLVDAVVEGVRGRKGAEVIVEELRPALEEESVQLVRKAWRVVVFLTESWGRGLEE